MVMRTSDEVNVVTLELQKGTHRIDWGDGIIEAGVSGRLIHEYATAAERIILVEKDSNEGGTEGYNTMVMTMAMGIKEIMQWWSDGYEVLGFALNSSEAQDTLVKVPKAAPRIFEFEKPGGGNAPVFIRCTEFNDPNILHWDVSNWGDFTSFFDGCFKFNQPIGLHWNFEKATRFYGFLQNCKNYNQPWPNFSTVSFTDPDAISCMFNGAESLDQDFSKWCVTNISSDQGNLFLNTFSGTKVRPQHLPIWGTCPI